MEPPDLPEGLTKVVRHPGAGRRPQPGDTVKLKYTGKLEDGSTFDSSDVLGKPMELTIGSRRVVPGFELGVASMRKREVATLTVPPGLAYGAEGAPPKIPGNATLTFEVELLAIDAPGDLFGDGGVVLTTVEPSSECAHPVEGQECVVSYVLRNDAVELARGDRELLQVGARGHLSVLGGPTVQRVLEAMTCGQVCRLEVQPAYVRAPADGAGAAQPAALLCDLTLHSMRELVDCSLDKDTSVLKSLVRPGVDLRECGFGTKVSARVFVEGLCRCLGGKDPAKCACAPKGYCSRDIDFTALHGAFCEMVETAASRMCVGEEARVLCTDPEQFADLSLGIPASERRVRAQIEVLRADFVEPLRSDAEQHEALVRRKELGSRLLQMGRFRLAACHYEAVAEAAGRLDDGMTLARQARSNLAMCLLKLKRWCSCLELCNRLLADTPGNSKLLYRRAVANAQLSEFSAAIADLQQVLALEPESRESQKLLATCQADLKAEGKQCAGLYSRMFSDAPREAVV